MEVEVNATLTLKNLEIYPLYFNVCQQDVSLVEAIVSSIFLILQVSKCHDVNIYPPLGSNFTMRGRSSQWYLKIIVNASSSFVASCSCNQQNNDTSQEYWTSNKG